MRAPKKHRIHPTARAIADAMRDAAAAGGACTENDLLCAGFSADDIASHAAAARQIAAQTSAGQTSAQIEDAR